MKQKRLKTDILIIGGGTAGCYAALTIAAKSDAQILICEKAHIKRSGCLAAGVNALNAYITEGRVPQDYVDYAKRDADGIVREDLLLTMSERLNAVTARLEQLGLVILKDKDGKYVTRGNRNLKINGENIKPILAEAVEKLPQVTVYNRVNITDFAVENGRIQGAFGIGIEDETFYAIEAKAVLVATGGAAGLYKPNNPGFSRHKMWYPPFNTGAGYAMGIRAGAEMTTFEMRFIALRCKDTIAPTGTLAQGVSAKQINSHGEVYEQKYGLTTSERVYGTVNENLEGRGPCYLQTEGITPEQDDALMKAYLNMAPSQTLKWIESGKMPSQQNVEIEGTEPYIVGGHTASGYWVDTRRATTIPGLYAAGDVAGGCPQKYVTGALAEGEIAGEAMVDFLKTASAPAAVAEETVQAHIAEAEKFLQEKPAQFTTEQLEEAMQTVMDAYAGGIKTNYRFNEKQLAIADEKIVQLMQLSDPACRRFSGTDVYCELRERLVVCRSVIAHLGARKETRWHSFAENLDYPQKDDANWKCYVNSRLKNGKIQVILRDLVTGGQTYEHSH
ncbi:adenylyl-sulfate reductase subunit alpha [Ruminococcus sp.]|uniref:adenylyl-sulfate reductase subunit alpha n=1 Tax=Ruminococcus sp. TaxID=41978 RepID=UPI003995479C